MIYRRTSAQSLYVHHAKIHTAAQFDLTSSSVCPVSARELPLAVEAFEINGSSSRDYEPLVERIAARSGVRVEQVVSAFGASMANHVAFAACFEPGDEVLIEQPTYEPLIRLAEMLGAQVRRFPRREENAFAIDPDDVRSAISDRVKLIVLCNLHNPTSALIPTQVLTEIGAIARQVGARVLVDEVYREAVWGDEHSTAAQLGPEFVVTSSLTKAFGLGGLRAGWVLAEPELARRMRRMQDLFGSYGVHIGEQASCVAFDQLNSLTARARTYLDANRSAARGVFSGREDLATIPDYGTCFAAKIPHGRADEFCEFAEREYQTSVVPGSYFEMPSHVRVGLGGDHEMTREGLARLRRALDEWK